MRRAEARAEREGKVLRDGATPLTGEELDSVRPLDGKTTNLIVYLALPVVLIIGVALTTFFYLGSTKILEAFLAAVIYLAVALSLGRHFTGVNDATAVAIQGVKAVIPAILILALAYSINTVSQSLGTSQFILSLTAAWMSPLLLPVLTFVTASLISFFTGTAWGTYAIVTPLVMPIAMSFSGDSVSSLVLATVGAIMGGGILGDHCSPVSDTTCLASFGAGSDHMDHVATQLPYALVCGVLTGVALLAVGGWIVTGRL